MRAVSSAAADGYSEGDAVDAAAAAPAGPAEPPEPAERFETSGKRARGRRPGVHYPANTPEPAVPLPDKPFIGTVLPGATKAARVAEAKKCVRYLQLATEYELQRRPHA